MDLGGVHLGLARIPRKCITVHPNGDFSQGRVLYVQTDWDMDALLNAASQRLEMVPSARRLFNADGIEIEDVLMIEDGTFVFVSSGADFIPITLDRDGEDSDDGEEGGGPRSSGHRAHKSGIDSGRPGSPGRGSSGIPASVGAYMVGELLGRGGFGEVRLGHHQLTHEKVALKFLPKSSIVASMGAAERATTEIQCLMALNHPNVIRLVQQYETPKYMVMVFELMEGGDLHHYLASLPVGCLSEDEARTVFHQIVGAVSYAHNHHICHRDLKLDNVLLNKEGHTTVFKIADFGLSDFYPPGATRRSQCGSLSYLAPEVFRGTSNAGPPIDVWALGVILFALLSGRLPFEAGHIKAAKGAGSSKKNSNLDEETIIRNRIVKGQYKMDDSLSPEAKDLIRRMLKLDPTERATMPEVMTHCWLRMRHSTMFELQHPRLCIPEPTEAKEEKALLMGVGGIKMALSPRSSLVGRSSKPSSPTSMSSLPPTLPPTSARDPKSAKGTITHQTVPPMEAMPKTSSSSSSSNSNGDSVLGPLLTPTGHDGDGSARSSGLRTLSPPSKIKEMGGTPMVPIMLDTPLLTSPHYSRNGTNPTFNLDLPALDRESTGGLGDSYLGEDKSGRRSPTNRPPSSSSLLVNRTQSVGAIKSAFDILTSGGESEGINASSSTSTYPRSLGTRVGDKTVPLSPNASSPGSSSFSRSPMLKAGGKTVATGAGAVVGASRSPRTSSAMTPSLKIPLSGLGLETESEEAFPSTASARSTGLLPSVTSGCRSPAQRDECDYESEPTTPGGSSIAALKQPNTRLASINSPVMNHRGSRRGRDELS